MASVGSSTDRDDATIWRVTNLSRSSSGVVARATQFRRPRPPTTRPSTARAVPSETTKESVNTPTPTICSTSELSSVLSIGPSSTELQWRCAAVTAALAASQPGLHRAYARKNRITRQNSQRLSSPSPARGVEIGPPRHGRLLANPKRRDRRHALEREPRSRPTREEKL